jgi:hypothetical protein
MKYHFSLYSEGRLRQEGKRSGKVFSFEELTRVGDDLYFKYVEGTPTPWYPPAVLLVRTGSGSLVKYQLLSRRQDSNMSSPRLWKEEDANTLLWELRNAGDACEVTPSFLPAGKEERQSLGGKLHKSELIDTYLTHALAEQAMKDLQAL